MKKFSLKEFLIGLAVGALILGSAVGGALADRIFVIKPLDYLFKRQSDGILRGEVQEKIFIEESVVTEVVEKVSNSVVTVSIETPQRRVLEFSPFGGLRSRIEGGQPQDIGTGFIVSADGLIVTNKHVVSQEDASYKVITSDNKEYEAAKISRDPSNDL